MEEQMNKYKLTAWGEGGDIDFEVEFECLAVNLDTQNGWITYVPKDESAVGYRILDTWMSFSIDQLVAAEPQAEATTAEAVA
jgi:hypothetical protein